ncbi:phenazine biosynthesis protein PhzF [Mycolicibacterium madagascariense]|uniref:Phenazine biosynthesis protein PhzF n=1 Tax=Mycolicibacterium madagascariense TaxID=212765 RepID=A0A7I7XIX4_9MYCO|nr:PhzF family phenazine biosynthesis protein [Mycolicibacterium madagascariense]BBZ29103.1 phenazine biosynthesis protein PhzF [Mycolicibacterium madagascariense]
MHQFSQVDVFTSRFTYGNPVAVVHDCDDLPEEQMAAFARWTNLSETTFLLTPTDPEADYRLRIFTTARELPFAGHPTLGSARAWLAAGGVARSDGVLVQECGVGLVRLRNVAGRWAFAAPPLLRGGPVAPDDVAEVAAAVGVAPSDVVDAQWADNGPGWVALLLASADHVLALDPVLPRAGRFPTIGVVGPHRPGTSDADVEVRAFTSTEAASEDPVTGSLNAALGQWLIAAGHLPTSYVAAQGTRLGRRGRVYVNLEDDQVWVAGDTVVGVRGEVALPSIE